MKAIVTPQIIDRTLRSYFRDGPYKHGAQPSIDAQELRQAVLESSYAMHLVAELIHPEFPRAIEVTVFAALTAGLHLGITIAEQQFTGETVKQ
jgi:hypothetical protein